MQWKFQSKDLKKVHNNLRGTFANKCIIVFERVGVAVRNKDGPLPSSAAP